MTSSARYTFDIALHPGPHEAAAGPPHDDAWGRWPTRTQRLAGPAPLGPDFEACLARLTALPRMFVEPDGALLWTGTDTTGDGRPWQVDGTAWECAGRLLRIDLKGSCPTAAFDALLAACGWPTTPFVVELVRPAVLLEIETFRRHAAARATPTADARPQSD